MPRFKSVGGVWYPISKSTRREMEAAGKETLGSPVKDQSSAASEAPIENEDLHAAEGSKKTKKKLKRFKKKLGVKSKKVRRKVG